MVQEDGKVSGSEEQYQFVDDGGASDQFELPEDDDHEAVAPTSPIAALIHKARDFAIAHRALTMAALLVFSVFVVYQFVGSPTPSTQQQTTTHVQLKAAKRGADAALAQRVASMHSGMSDQLNSVRQQTQATQMNLNTLGHDVRNTEMKLAELQRQNHYLLQKINNMNHQLTKVNDKLFPGAKPAPLVYAITAIVPGRAWLSSNRGDELTVRLGSQLPKYGTVKWINADAGLIGTSSGKTIHFSVNP